MEQREAFLNHLAKKLGRDRRRKNIVKPNWSLQPQWEVLRDKSENELIDVLEKQCKNIHTTFKRTSLVDLPQVLEEIISQAGGGPIITPKDDRHVTFGTASLLEAQHAYYWDEAEGLENITMAEQANIGICFSEITLAESGTVTLFHNRYHSRSISILPKQFIAIIPKETIVPRMSQATKMIRDEIQRGNTVPSCISFVTGPSNSADIEMNLVVGVHGPVNATYIVIDG